MNKIQDAVSSAWTMGRKTRKSSKGWITSNGVCCVHNGETPDKRGRGGLILNGDMVSYHCFNCNFKTGWQPGWHLSYKMRKFMSWIGIDEGVIKRLVFESMRIRDEEGVVETDKEEINIHFEPEPLPEKAKRIEELLTFYAIADFETIPDDLMDVVAYAVEKRGLTHEQVSDMYWTPEKVSIAQKMNRRLIIPYKWNNEIIGYTARCIDDNKQMKYYNKSDSNYVFNTDAQMPDAKVVLVTEGPFDALAINGVAMLGNEVSETKAEIIDMLNREVIVVPDRGAPGQKLVDVALECGWNVSFPDWEDPDIDDVNAAVCKYGKLYTFQHIMAHKYDTRLKIELTRKKY